ncbi:hypothetical protein GLOTRDRAFT_126963 [Gloeophyllum trabeum ATCC 11539]|uniref:Mitochondrial cytochrome c oxidase assembly factor n=1 Tax=Gloeophyllum trabeum (strain ATCC 11539 / FP-39264 / Madison 617) TaxID=670483 RepID=S7QF42_GLOTA|nr:uncharacterized protein GLOTRDRAFT_126963 [Gloeophyllum trabeum ATCC 11539]EPQ58466.1 hypothetical protein GLOTRDRAFT_126963 [Gloeophyllum trabeum ATCC 11539]
MGGPNLEIFKFAVYTFFPVAALLYYGDPEWYNRHVLPYKEKMFPEDKGSPNIPTDQGSVREELARIRAEKMARKMERERAEGGEQPGSSGKMV